MKLFETMTAEGHEEVVFWHDRASGLRAIVAIHDTTLGPSLGGTRMLPYPSEQVALEDVLRLSRAMTYKNAAAGLDFGGGKAVIIGDPAKDKSEALFRAYGRLVETLGGRYVTTTDVGTMTPDLDIIRSETTFVTGTSPAYGGSGDTSVLTGRTVYQGMRASADEAWGAPELRGRTVAVQGAGKVGWHLMELLHADGATLVVTDVNAKAAERAVVAFGARSVAPDALYDEACDVFSPNALGGSISEQNVPRLKCRIVCGGANNQLATPKDMQRLSDRGILYAPDFIVNSGGVINIADEAMGYNRDRAFAKGDAVFETTRRIFAIAREQQISTEAAAEHFAEERMRTLAGVHRTLVPNRSPIPR
ncbi:MAG: Glu/Leu/Phe/Val family dehydrogenase [Dehalococcoidia bacterium]